MSNYRPKRGTVEALRENLYFADVLDRSVTRKPCDVCGVISERKEMTAMDEYERFVVCQRCRFDLCPED